MMEEQTVSQHSSQGSNASSSQVLWQIGSAASSQRSQQKNSNNNNKKSTGKRGPATNANSASGNSSKATQLQVVPSITQDICRQTAKSENDYDFVIQVLIEENILPNTNSL